MNQTLSMVLRYAITGGVAFAAGKGWLTPDQAGPVTEALIQVGVAVVAAAPVIYAALKIDNGPKKS